MTLVIDVEFRTALIPAMGAPLGVPMKRTEAMVSLVPGVSTAEDLLTEVNTQISYLTGKDVKSRLNLYSGGEYVPARQVLAPPFRHIEVLVADAPSQDIRGRSRSPRRVAPDAPTENDSESDILEHDIE